MSALNNIIIVSFTLTNHSSNIRLDKGSFYVKGEYNGQWNTIMFPP